MSEPPEPPEPRVPHADRPPARHLCGCVWMHTTNPGDPAGPAVERRIHTDPDCPLHGPNAEPAPF